LRLFTRARVPGRPPGTRWGSLAPSRRDDLLGDARRHLRVGVELHAVDGPALGLASQVTHVPEHLRERDEGANDLDTRGPVFHRLDLPTTTIEVTDDVTHVFLGR